MQADKYTYEMCMYGNAAQKDAHLHTSLGSWEGFKDGYSLARFANGQGCWQGPPRSLQASAPCMLAFLRLLRALKRVAGSSICHSLGLPLSIMQA